MPASIAANIVAAERDVPGNTAARICAMPTQCATRHVSSSLFGWRSVYASIRKMARPPITSAQATGATVSGNSSPICFAAKPPMTVMTKAVSSLNR